MAMRKEKEECWRKISEEFNSQGVLVARSCAQLQLKYKNLKKVVRKKSALIRIEHLKTGGGKDLSQALNLREEKLKSMIQLSVDGLQSEFDDDTENISTDNLVNDNELMDNDDEDKDNETYYVTVMPDLTEDFIPSTSTNKQQPFRKENMDIDGPSNYETANEAGRSFTDFGVSVKQWDVVTPQHIKHVKSAPLKKIKNISKADPPKQQTFCSKRTN